MKITLASLPVNDQEKAHKFYTDVLGFRTKTDAPMGEYRWLTVVSPDDTDGVELVLEPMAFPPARDYQKALHDAGIPWTSFAVENIDEEFRRLTERGVVFTVPVTTADWGKSAMFDDTCGNLIGLHEPGA